MLFNVGLDVKSTRAIDIAENDKINEAALKDLIRDAVDFNMSNGKQVIQGSFGVS